MERIENLNDKLSYMVSMADLCSDRLGALNETPGLKRRSYKKQFKNYSKGLEIISASILKNISKNLNVDNVEVKLAIQEERIALAERKKATKTSTDKAINIMDHNTQAVVDAPASVSLLVQETQPKNEVEVSNNQSNRKQKNTDDMTSA